MEPLRKCQSAKVSGLPISPKLDAERGQYKNPIARKFQIFVYAFACNPFEYPVELWFVNLLLILVSIFCHHCK